MTAKKTMTFEESMAALEEVVQRLEQGDVPLEEALTQFKYGIELSKVCQETLTNAEKTLTKMMTDENEEVLFESEAE
ncbi:exodeoxyribonuclease VII small subunit [Vagococcus entomophilus]|uniref:Exodeoxyribonuclease 7 small subunit n=1 Tax=Vagococcus entomophilus TaxID=1160095 RepID=A0A430AI67_9ENTE|nr:exodeoxyribonuclease VII small subunit [Vagococcus entomophilus]RSU07816.1 exodeoxyribonuclease VII small subunit [Vagococcus entomophilus]